MQDLIDPIIGPLLLVLLLMWAGIGTLYLVLDRTEKAFEKGKRSPFPQEFLRGPGHSLYEKIEDLRLDFMGWLMGVMIMPAILMAVPLSQAYLTGKRVSLGLWVMVAVVWIATTVWLCRKAITTFKTIRQLRLGYEGEVGVGQELNLLMLNGYRVYHDFPAQQFNIDHVVIGPAGVFAIETKARSKPVTGGGKRDATVVCHGDYLAFPNGSDYASIEQALRQARWLSQWLTRAVGEKVPVKAALVIPGWFVERKKIGDVLVFNARESKNAIVGYRGAQLSAEMIQRIAHQVEEKCRDVAPKSYRDTNAHPAKPVP
ncbi:MAG: NERD domain-containing protein [Chromatiaceae bacterium]|nr:NERD domain-containing protein [Chromatiaceae bacterium]